MEMTKVVKPFIRQGCQYFWQYSVCVNTVSSLFYFIAIFAEQVRSYKHIYSSLPEQYHILFKGTSTWGRCSIALLISILSIRVNLEALATFTGWNYITPHSLNTVNLALSFNAQSYAILSADPIRDCQSLLKMAGVLFSTSDVRKCF